MTILINYYYIYNNHRIIYIYIESKRTHRFSVTLSFVPKHSSNRVVRQNWCVLFDSFTYIYTALLPQHWALYEKVDSTPKFIYLYIYIYIAIINLNQSLWIVQAGESGEVKPGPTFYLTLDTLRVTRIYFLLTISPLNHTLRSWEYKKWSPTKETWLFDKFSLSAP